MIKETFPICRSSKRSLVPPSLKKSWEPGTFHAGAPEQGETYNRPGRWDTDNDIAGTSYLEISDAIFHIRFFAKNEACRLNVDPPASVSVNG